MSQRTSASGVKMISVARNVYKWMQIAMKTMCILYDVLFQRMMKAVTQSSKDISKDVNGVHCNPLYDIRRITKLLNSEHHWLSLQDIILFMDLIYKLIDLHPRGHIHCTALQFRIWYELLIVETEEVDKHKPLSESEATVTQMTKFLCWGQKHCIMCCH